MDLTQSSNKDKNKVFVLLMFNLIIMQVSSNISITRVFSLFIIQNLLEEYEKSREIQQEHPHDESKEIFDRVPRLSNTIGGDLSIMCTEACRGRRCVGPPCGTILRKRKRAMFPQAQKGLKQICENACQGRNCFGPPCYRSHKKRQTKKTVNEYNTNFYKY